MRKLSTSCTSNDRPNIVPTSLDSSPSCAHSRINISSHVGLASIVLCQNAIDFFQLMCSLEAKLNVLDSLTKLLVAYVPPSIVKDISSAYCGMVCHWELLELFIDPRLTMS